MSLRNRVAFVTGAGSGIGAAGARALAREGATVIVSDRDGDAARAVTEGLIHLSGIFIDE